jgi:putative hydrolase of HD superfamily
MAFVAGTQPGYDASKCVKMALMHDIAEAIVGDITPHDGVSKADKHAREAAAVVRMQLMLGQRAWAVAGAEMLSLWEEYEACATPEALLLKDLDKVEMILQAHEYEQAQGLPLEEFFRSTAGAWLTPEGRALAGEVVSRRTACAAAGAGGAATAAKTVAEIGDDLADLGALGDGFGA